MSVREVVKALRTAKEIQLGVGANAISFDKNDPFMMEVYGDYVIDEIRADGEGYFELNIAMRPVKVGAV